MASVATAMYNLYSRKVSIDNCVFRLHYKFTLWILILFSIMVFTNQGLFTKPINCVWRSSWHDIDIDFLNNFCLVHPTFSQQEDWGKEVGEEIPYPGIGKHDKSKTLVFHSYYQWVATVLFFQALLFYIPRYYWRVMEGGRVQNIVQEIQKCRDIAEFQKDGLKWTTLVAFERNGIYHFSYFLAEIMNLVNVFGQIFLVNVFLGGAFLEYGLETIKFSDWKSTPSNDPMIRVFPRMAECVFHRYGSSGDVQRYRTSCLLPVNILNEKIYVFLWFWFLLLAILSSLAFLHRVLTNLSPVYQVVFMKMIASSSEREDLWRLRAICSNGDRFFISSVVCNLDSVQSRWLISILAKGFRTYHEDSPNCRIDSFKFKDLDV